MGNVTNILVGVGRLHVSAPLDPATLLPDDNETDPTQWREVGFTMEGVEISFEPDIVDIIVDQLGDAAKLIEQSQKVMLKTTLAEATLTNLCLAWGYDETAADQTVSGLAVNGDGDNQFNIGVNPTGIPLERSLYFIGKGPGGVDRAYTANRVVSISSSSHSYKRGEATVFPIELRLLPHADKTGQEYGTIIDYTS